MPENQARVEKYINYFVILGTDAQLCTHRFLRSVYGKNLDITRTFYTVGTDAQIIYKKYYVHIRVCKKVLLIFPCRCVPTRNGGKTLWQLLRTMTIS